jgi:hypothetical protein
VPNGFDDAEIGKVIEQDAKSINTPTIEMPSFSDFILIKFYRLKIEL